MNARPTVAVIGASSQRHKFGNRAVRAFASRGYQVFPVNPHEKTVEGLPTYPSVRDVPVDRLDRITIYTQPSVTLQLLEDFASKPVGEVWFNPGADRPDVVVRARALGLPVVVGCSILDIGVDPHGLPG